MQQQRLMRSRNEIVLSGVCGGLGEYFGIDPVIIRLIFVLVTLTTGLGLLVYPALWIAMPKAPLAPPQWPEPALGVDQQIATYAVQRERVTAGHARSAAPPPPTAYNFDPLTGEALRSDAAFGQTTQLPYDPSAPEFQGLPITPARRLRHGGRWVALGLIAVGALILADHLGFDTDLVFPLIMIVGGILLLRRK